MKLTELLRGVAIEEVSGQQGSLELPAIDIRDVRDDSRHVESGDLFVAMSGQTVDGHAFVATAKQRGAAAVIVEKMLPLTDAPLQIRVASTARALAEVAANRYGRPADALTLVAVTGTNGKTTTTHLVEAMLEEAGQPTGLLGTIAYRFRDKSWPAPFTTPTAIILHQTLAELRAQGATGVALEASSHALQLDRLHGVHFRVAALTNITQDHLDFHGDMEQYFAAKAKLFLDGQHLLPKERGGRAVLPIDDPYGRRLAAMLPAGQKLTVSAHDEADVSVQSAQITIDGITAVLKTPVGEVALNSRLTGGFNLSNLMLAAGIGAALGLSAEVIGRGLSRLPGVPGRLERVGLPRGMAGPSVFVDYAHTPDALERALTTLRPLSAGGAARGGRLVVVFGCGGDRDAGKRAQMGQVAARAADLSIITSDNPRSEDPQRIIDMILEGVTIGTAGRGTRLDRAALATAATGYTVEVDRRQAIAAAIAAARPEDVILIAGKGHEDYQIVGGVRHPFDDREEAQKALFARPDAAPRSGPGMTGASSSGTLQAVPAVAPNIELPLERVVASTGGKLVRGGAHKFTAVTIDSRAVVPGALFVAVRGQNHDGHNFCAQAVSAGAAGLLVDRGRAPKLPDGTAVAVIEVGDTHVALGQVARAHREAPEIAGKLRVVAVTGSSGKTTTKDLIASIFLSHVQDPAEVVKTEGNLNNHFGVPLTLLRIRPGQRFAVVELGMSGRGEIAYLTSLCRPNVGVITNVGPAHLLQLGTVDNVAAAKGELFSGLTDGAAAVYLGGPEHGRIATQATSAGAAARSGRLRAVTALREGESPSGQSPSVVYRVFGQTEEGLEMELRCLSPVSGNLGAPVVARVPLVGVHHADNAALAAAAALSLDVPPTVIAQGLGRVLPGKHRGQLLTVAGRRVLDDCYNANPASTVAALKTLVALQKKGRTVAVLGDMLELGPDEAALHAEVGEAAASCGVSLVVAVGPLSANIAKSAAARGIATVTAASAEAAAAAVAKQSAPGDWILIKGSRGMALEHVLDHLRAKLEGASSSEAR